MYPGKISEIPGLKLHHHYFDMNRRIKTTLTMIPVMMGVLLLLSGCGKNDPAESQVPDVISLSVTDIHSNGVTLKAALRPGSLPVETTFEYGSTTDYGNSVPGSDDPVISHGVRAVITSLTRGAEYHFRLKAVNAAGTVYSRDMTFTPAFGIGEAYGGGFIIYLDESGEHGLIAAETDQSEGIIWDNGTDCKKTNVTTLSIGAGQANTTRLVSVLGLGSYPARKCDELVLNGFSDWFLPSLEELDCMQKALSVFDREYNLNGIYYWTSSEAPETEVSRSCSAWVQNLFTGEKRSWAKNDPTPYVRAVRAF
jgi:hypothetical protein